MAESNEKAEIVLFVEEAEKGSEQRTVIPAAARKWGRDQPIMVETLDTRGKPEMTGLEETENKS